MELAIAFGVKVVFWVALFAGGVYVGYKYKDVEKKP